ncbi:hypothetical protein PSHT_04536 [Puccinia striiformis]|nr:hypothetical protein PSTT_05069 [Puccinia striiformis]POW19556.1 hypothetical protein PSHT_04536 [Puccinia striiformis]
MSSLNQSTSANQHPNPPPYQRFQNHGWFLHPCAPARLWWSCALIGSPHLYDFSGKKIRPIPTIRTGSPWCKSSTFQGS